MLATNSSADNTGTGSITTSDVTLNSKLVSTYSKLVGSKKVIREVISNLSLDMEKNIKKECKCNSCRRCRNDTDISEK
ncbi:MAG: hypothetical protein V8R51_07970 [Clostridia bacterium]